MIDVLLVDDHALVRRTLRAILETEPTLAIVGEAADGLEAIHVAEAVHPHVVLMDLYMPGMDGIESTRQIHRHFPETCIIGMSSESGAWVKEGFLSAGARAFLPKELVPGHLVEVIHKECSL